MPSRHEIRQHIRSLRSNIAAENRDQLSRQISDRVMRLDAYQRCESIAAFLSFEGEADPIDLMTQANSAGKRVYVPVVLGRSQPLRFAPWTPDAPQQPNRYGILEPQVSEADLLRGDQLEFVVTPLVAFDAACNRIGVGGGYYDRSFAFINKADRPSRPQLCGFAFATQQVDSIEPESWDVQLDWIATESEIITRQ